MMRVVAGLFSRHWETEWVSKVGFRSCSEGVALWRACTHRRTLAYTVPAWSHFRREESDGYRRQQQQAPCSITEHGSGTRLSKKKLVCIESTPRRQFCRRS